jgi:hypothetical protein
VIYIRGFNSPAVVFLFFLLHTTSCTFHYPVNIQQNLSTPLAKETIYTALPSLSSELHRHLPPIISLDTFRFNSPVGTTTRPASQSTPSSQKRGHHDDSSAEDDGITHSTISLLEALNPTHSLPFDPTLGKVAEWQLYPITETTGNS